MDEKQFMDAMQHIVAALKEKGYDPYVQLSGYVAENKPTYITSYRGARELIVSLEMERVRHFVKTMQ